MREKRVGGNATRQYLQQQGYSDLLAQFDRGDVGGAFSQAVARQQPIMRSAAVLPEMKRMKFSSESAAAQIMTPLHQGGAINGWDITPAGYVRFFDPAARVWRDLTPYDLTRFGVK